MKAVVLINPAAGGVTAAGADRMRRVLRSTALSGADIVEADFSAGESQMRALLAKAPDLLIVWGGDGTHRSALKVAGRNASNLLLLPGGTMSLLSKSLHGDRPWQEILEAVVANPQKRTLPAGQINDEFFYCAMLAGAPVRFAEARESLRHGDIGKVVSQVGSGFDAFQTVHLKARYSDGYEFADGRLPTTSVIGAFVGPMSHNGRMEVAALTHPSTFSALSFVWSSFLHGWRDAPDVTVVAAEALVIDSEEGGNIPVIIDGEAITVGNHVRVTYVEGAAQCLTAGGGPVRSNPGGKSLD